MSGSGRQTLSSPAEKIASPCAPSRSNSFSKYSRIRSKSAFSADALLVRQAAGCRLLRCARPRRAAS